MSGQALRICARCLGTEKSFPRGCSQLGCPLQPQAQAAGPEDGDKPTEQAIRRVPRYPTSDEADFFAWLETKWRAAKPGDDIKVRAPVGLCPTCGCQIGTQAAHADWCQHGPQSDGRKPLRLTPDQVLAVLRAEAEGLQDMLRTSTQISPVLRTEVLSQIDELRRLAEALPEVLPR